MQRIGFLANASGLFDSASISAALDFGGSGFRCGNDCNGLFDTLATAPVSRCGRFYGGSDSSAVSVTADLTLALDAAVTYLREI